MKIVREHINEKFKEKSDPISDMGIGIKQKWDKTIPLLNAAGAYRHINDHLWLLSKNGYADLIEYALSLGADIHYKSDRALRWAVAMDKLDVAKILLDNGADVNAFNNGPYNLAVQNENDEMIKLLKSYGGEPRTIDMELKENLNEKFSEKSDPIKDMGIGILNKTIDFKSKEDFRDVFIQLIPRILKMKEIPKDIITHKDQYGILKYQYFYILSDYLDKYMTINDKRVSDYNFPKNNSWTGYVREKLKEMGY